MDSKPKLNKPLLRKILKHILKEPKRLEMGNYMTTKKMDAFLDEHGDYFPECDTTGCVAGWAVLLSVPKAEWGWWRMNWPEIPVKAQKLLGLDATEARRLFLMATDRPRDEQLERVKAAIESLLEREE